MSESRTEHIARALCEFDGVPADSNAFPEMEPDCVIPAWRRLNYVGYARAAEAAAAEWDAMLKSDAPHPFPRETHWPEITAEEAKTTRAKT